jgi:hypothetical protein
MLDIKFINKVRQSPYNPNLHIDMLDWYATAVEPKAVRNTVPWWHPNPTAYKHATASMQNWKEASGGTSYTVKNKKTNLEDYCARTFVDHFKAENVAKIAEKTILSHDKFGLDFRKNKRDNDKEFLFDMLDAFENKANTVSWSNKPNYVWRLAMIMLDTHERIEAKNAGAYNGKC